MDKPTCSTADCDRKVYYRGICRKHYDLEGGYNKQIRPRVDFTCISCGNVHNVQKRMVPAVLRCPPCAWAHAATKRTPRVTAPAYPSCPLHIKSCAHCARLYACNHNGLKYCSDVCRREAQMVKLGCRNRECKQCGASLGYKSLDNFCTVCKDARHREYRLRDRATRPKGMKSHESRARHFGVPSERIDRAKVYDRDRWVCGICEGPIPQDATYPNPLSVSLDHVTPLSRGGGHLYSNVQASHLECNVRKGASLQGV